MRVQRASNGVQRRLSCSGASHVLVPAPFGSRFPWWKDARFWGAYPLAIAMLPAGVYGVWYEVFVVGEYVCFHSVWGTAFLIGGFAMLFFNTRRLRRFNAIMSDASASHFFENRKEVEELLPELPRACTRRYKARLEAVTSKRRRSDAGP